MSNEAVNIEPQITESETQESNENYDVSDARDVVAKAVEGQTPSNMSKEEIKQMQEELFDLMIDGQAKKFNLGNDKDKAELKRLAQLGGAGQKRMQEAAQLKKEVDGLMAQLKNAPDKVLAGLGIDVNTFAEQILKKEIERMQKSPEQLQREEMENELKQLKAQMEEERQTKDSLHKQQLQEQAAISIDKEITEELSSLPDFPKTPYAVARIASAMMWAMENGYPDVTVKQIIPQVKEQINREMRGHLETLPEDIIEQYLGENLSEKLRKLRMKKAKAAQALPPSKKVESTGADVKNRAPKEVKPVEKISMKQFLYGKK